MRRGVFAWVALLTLLVPWAVSAQNIASGPVFVSEPVTWRTSTTSGGFLGTLDSTVVRRSGAVQVADTTAAISLLNLSQPLSGLLTSSVAAADTLLVGAFNIFPTNNSAFPAGGDSIYVTQQVSNNGTDWHTLFTALDVLEIGTSNCYSRALYSSSVNIVTQSGFTGFNLIRFIVLNGGTDFTGEYTATFSYWTNRLSRM